MKLAHLILAHNNPQQLERLVKRLSHPDADVYIHLDSKTDITGYAGMKELPNTYWIKNRVKVAWGEYSVIEATIAGMEEILGTGNIYSHINLLSGNDYPLKSASEIQRFLFANTGKTFIWHEKIFDEWHHGQVRMNSYYLGHYGFPGRYQLSAIISKLLPKRKLPYHLTAYGRSQWLTITPECAKYALKYIKEHIALERYFKMTWAVDEVFFQTILCNSPLKDTLINDNLRYIRLTKDFRPAIYTMADTVELTTSGKFYTRKFDMVVDSAIFDYLDSL